MDKRADRFSYIIAAGGLLTGWRLLLLWLFARLLLTVEERHRLRAAHDALADWRREPTEHADEPENESRPGRVELGHPSGD